MNKKTLLLFGLLALVMLSGCESTQRVEVDEKVKIPKPINITAFQKSLFKGNRCGDYHFRPPFFNVTGLVTSKVPANTKIYLFVAPNTEFNNTLWLVRHCKLYFQDNITEEGTFEFTQIPIGTYVAMVPAWSFRRGQGFPVINEFEEQGYQADIAWHGGDSQYSLVAFMIEPIPEGSAVRHYE